MAKSYHSHHHIFSDQKLSGDNTAPWPVTSFTPVKICCLTAEETSQTVRDESRYLELWAWGRRPIYSWSRPGLFSCQRLTNNGYNWGYRSLQGFSLFLCVGLKSCQHNSITYLHFKWRAHLHFPFTFPSKTNYFLFIMEGWGMVVVVIFFVTISQRSQKHKEGIKKHALCITTSQV